MLSVLIGCASTTSARLAEKIEPLRSVWVAVSLGSFGPAEVRKGPTRGEGMRARFVPTLQRNGVEVSGYHELARPLNQLGDLEQLWARQPALHAATSHVLVLTAQRMISTGPVGGIPAQTLEYEAVLWDTVQHRLVWKGAPRSGLNVYDRDASLQAEVLAGDILRALQRDGVIALPQGGPIGADGAEIPRQWVPVRIL